MLRGCAMGGGAVKRSLRDLPERDATLAVAGHERAPGPREPRDRSPVPADRLDDGTRRDVADPDDTVESAARHATPVRSDGEALERAASLGPRDDRPRGRVPDAEHTVPARRQEPGLVREG